MEEDLLVAVVPSLAPCIPWIVFKTLSFLSSWSSNSRNACTSDPITSDPETTLGEVVATCWCALFESLLMMARLELSGLGVFSSSERMITSDERLPCLIVEKEIITLQKIVRLV